MDVLSAVLRSLRLKASIYCAMDLSAPWGMSLRKSAWAPFHLIESGSCSLVTGKGRRGRLGARDLGGPLNPESHPPAPGPGPPPGHPGQVFEPQRRDRAVR